MTTPSRLSRAPNLTAVFAASCLVALCRTARADDLQAAAPPPTAQAQTAPAAPLAIDAPPADEAPVMDPVAPPPVEDPEEELSTIEVRLWQLRRESRTQLIAPLALVVTGYGASLIGVLGACTTYAFAEQVQDRDKGDAWRGRLDVNDDGQIDGEDEATFRRMGRSFAVIGAVGALIGTMGTVFLVRGLRARADDAAEVRGLRQRRRQLRRELEYGANPYAGGMALSVRGRF